MGKDDQVRPLECITELLKVEQVVGENATQSSVIRDVALPGRVRKITEVDTTLRNVRGRVIENKVVVEGIVHKQIFYVDDDTGQLKEYLNLLAKVKCIIQCYSRDFLLSDIEVYPTLSTIYPKDAHPRLCRECASARGNC
ncbi:MAG: DUF3794 domain-containing protein [Desulfitobacterium hafniense]|nr:DUF3794 domain-containing protein [Desulfitobacterium hafniense]